MNPDKIKVVLSDVDGVLTDGGLYYDENGMVLKKFNVKDGMGVVRLRNAGYKTGIISTDNSQIIKTRAEKLSMEFVITGCWEKNKAVMQLCNNENISLENVAFIGDDVNDIELIKIVGFSACPADAMPEVKKIVDYVCTNKGGEAAFREFAEIILKSKEQ